MSDKILEKNGIDNSILDGARFNRFCAGYRDGIIKGSFEECKITKLASNIFQIGKGELLISGFRVITEAKQFTFNNLPSNAIRYQIVSQISLDDNVDPTYSCLVRTIGTIKQDNILNEKTSSGIYQIELARFTLASDGVSEFVTIADIITGDKCTGNAFNIGNITSEKIDVSLDAEVDITERIDKTDGKHYFDFKFILPVNFDRVTEEFKEAKQVAEEAKQTADGIDSKAQEALDKVNKLSSDPAKLDKNQGIENANKMVGTDESGNVVTTNVINLGNNVKLYSEIDEDGEITIILETPDEEETLDEN